LERLEGVVPAVGITRKVGLAHAAYQRADTSSICNGSGQREEQEISTGNKGIRQSLCVESDFYILREGCFAYSPKSVNGHRVIITQSRIPLRKLRSNAIQYSLSALEFDNMTLAIFESDRFHH